MIVLALLLLIAAVALIVFIVVTGTTETVTLDWRELNIAFSPTPLVIFVLGAVTLLLVVLALGLLRGGTRRKVEQRRELKRLRKVEKENAAAAERNRRSDATAGTHAHDGPDAARASRVEHPAPADGQAFPTQAQPTRAQPTQGTPTHAPPTQGQPTQGQPTQGQPTQGPPTQGQPVHPPPADTGQAPTTQPAKTSDPAAGGTWHDEPSTDRPSGRHEAR